MSRLNEYTTRTLNCKGCENRCLIVKYDFGEGNVYYSGNRCEKVFHNGGKTVGKGRNANDEKYHLLFDRANTHPSDPSLRIGIPRALNMYEDFPFWHTLFSECGPDAFLTDAIRDLLGRHGKSLTMLKLDDISNVGSMKLRVRSLIDSLRISGKGHRAEVSRPSPQHLHTAGRTGRGLSSCPSSHRSSHLSSRPL